MDRIVKTILFNLTIFLFISCGNTPIEDLVIEESNNFTISDTVINHIQIPRDTLSVVFKLENDKVFFKIYESKIKNTIYFNIHDNENTSVEAARSVFNEIGGTLIEIQAQGKRLISFNSNKNIYKFDPNRIFSKNGIKKTLSACGRYSQNSHIIIQEFASFIVDSLLINAETIVTLHNNSNLRYSINSYKKDGKYEKDALKININPNHDPDDFFYVTDGNCFQLLKEKKYNAVLQDNKNVSDDGSLSINCSKMKIQYINVEAEHGHLREQIDMLLVLQEVLNKTNER